MAVNPIDMLVKSQESPLIRLAKTKINEKKFTNDIQSEIIH